MSNLTDVRVRCVFSRGGFPNERKFTIDAPGGGAYTGTAPVRYCFNLENQRLTPDEPPPGDIMQGWMTARVIQSTGDRVTISVPDGGVCEIRAEQIQDAHVPVES